MDLKDSLLLRIIQRGSEKLILGFKLWQIGVPTQHSSTRQLVWGQVLSGVVKLIDWTRVIRPRGEFDSWVTNFKLTWITLKPSIDHLFATYSYTSYWRVGEFLTISVHRSSYSPKFAWIPENIGLLLVFFSRNPSLQFNMTNLGKFGPPRHSWLSVFQMPSVTISQDIIEN